MTSEEGFLQPQMPAKKVIKKKKGGKKKDVDDTSSIKRLDTKSNQSPSKSPRKASVAS